MKSSKGVFVKRTLYFMLVTSGFIGTCACYHTCFAESISNAPVSKSWGIFYYFILNRKRTPVAKTTNRAYIKDNEK